MGISDSMEQDSISTAGLGRERDAPTNRMKSCVISFTIDAEQNFILLMTKARCLWGHIFCYFTSQLRIGAICLLFSIGQFCKVFVKFSELA